MVAATGEIVAAINGLQATLQGLTVSATVQGAAAAVRHAVSLTKADMDHLVTVTVAAGKASTDVSLAGVDLAAVIGAASIDAFDQMTTALVVHTMQVANAAVVMTARIGKAATLATHDLGLARIALQGAVGVADVTWATSVANAQSAYDALMGRGQVAAAERLRDPFVEYKATQAQIGGDLRTKLVVNDVERRIAAEQHATSSGGFNGDWSKTFTYVVGGLQMVGAVVEITIGATFVSASIASGATGIGIPIALMTGTLGAFMVSHGLDNLNTGFQTIVTGAPQRTLTSQALDLLTGNAFYSEVADTALGLLSGAAAGKIFRLAAMTDDMGRCLNMLGRGRWGAINYESSLGGARRLTLPAIDQTLSGSNTLGYTLSNGEVFLQPGMSRAAQAHTLWHEGVHAFLSVQDGALLASLRQKMGMAGYNNSAFLNALEETLAEGIASGSLRSGLVHAFNGAYTVRQGVVVTPIQAAAEAMIGLFGVGGTWIASYSSGHWLLSRRDR